MCAETPEAVPPVVLLPCVGTMSHQLKLVAPELEGAVHRGNADLHLALLVFTPYGGSVLGCCLQSSRVERPAA